jgi:acyl carrier protein
MNDERRSRAIKVIAGQFGILESEVTPEKRFVADFGADSLDDIELAMQIEDAFNVNIDDDDAEKCVTVADLFALVDSVLAAKA